MNKVYLCENATEKRIEEVLDAYNSDGYKIVSTSTAHVHNKNIWMFFEKI